MYCSDLFIPPLTPTLTPPLLKKQAPQNESFVNRQMVSLNIRNVIRSWPIKQQCPKALIWSYVYVGQVLIVLSFC